MGAKSVGIIGSGHTGIAAAKTLIRRGLRPLILDVGEVLDSERRQVVERMSGQHMTEWSSEDLAVVTQNKTLNQTKVKRLAFGSEYPYAESREFARLEVVKDGPTPTMAKGGFSTIWGGAMLPADDCDTHGWPITQADLAPYYREVLSGLPFSAAEDALSCRFPLYRESPGLILASPGIAALLRSMGRSRFFRNRADVLFGRARLAVQVNDGPTARGCVYCGRCLSGCVYGSIYSADQDLDRMILTGEAEYRPGCTVVRLSEYEDRVEVHYRTDQGYEKVALDRVFLAAGAINSTRLVLESKQLYDRPARMKTTQGFVVPMLTVRGAPFDWPNANTLTGAFLEFKTPEVGDHWIHCQIGTANELVISKLGYQPGPGGLTNLLKKLVLQHMLVAICNFHSDYAGAYTLTLREGNSGGNVLSIATEPSEDFARVLESGSRQLVRLMLRAGVLPLLPLRVGGDPKQPLGWHFGGSLPMTREPVDELDTDVLGRPKGWRRIHVVDSSIFPSVPATTIALLAAANATRIAHRAPLEV